MKNVLDALSMTRNMHGDFQDHFFEQAMYPLLADPGEVAYSFYQSDREKVPGSVRGAFAGDDRFIVIGEKHRSSRTTLYYSMPGGIVEVDVPCGENHDHTSIDAATLNLEAFDVVRGIAKSLLFSEPESGEVNILVETMRGFELKSIGLLSSQLERGNYSDDVLRSYDHVVECLGSPSPCGRLAILEGPPGTGKSYLIRALIREAKAHYVIVPCMLLGQLSGPTLLPVLLDAKSDDEDGKTLPVVLVIEDADAALVNRERGDPSKLSEMLNLGDGLLGELGDLRIVATTNAKRVDIDDAALRPGRLCRHVAVNDLDGAQADAVYAKLTGNAGNHYTGPRSLAQIYSDARDDGWRPRKRDDGSTGQYL